MEERAEGWWNLGFLFQLTLMDGVAKYHKAAGSVSDDSVSNGNGLVVSPVENHPSM